MSEPLEHAYFNWLYAKVCNPRAASKTQKFETLLQVLHKTEFVWVILGDDNRAEDGCDLRDEFLTASRQDAPQEWLEEGCSVLEMLIAFSRKAAFETSDTPKYWFWTMLENLGVSNMNDAFNPNQDQIRDILDVMVWRHYDELGNGGLFPLRESKYDQRYVEIWYQFSEYLYQNNIL